MGVNGFYAHTNFRFNPWLNIAQAGQLNYP